MLNFINTYWLIKTKNAFLKLIVMFDGSKCGICENIDCLTRCQWMSFENVEEARAEQMKMINGEESIVLKQCVTCFGCQEYCLYGSNPFYLKITLMEKYNSLLIDPGFLDSAIEINEIQEDMQLKDIDPNKPVLNKCRLEKSHQKHFQSELFNDLQSIGGRNYYCNFVYHHYARASITKKRVAQILSNLKKQGIKEMICFHEECYQLYSKYCPENDMEIDFKVIHLFKYIHDYLSNNKSRINKLNMKIAYQRPCSSRFVPESDDWVDKICDLIGVERVNRKYDRQNGLCCSGVFTLIGKKKLMRKAQNDNIEDMLSNGAEVCVYNCPMCMAAMGFKVGKKGLKNYLLSDLCKLALGESVD